MIQPRMIALLLIITIFSSCCQHVFANIRCYELGTTYQYKYNLTVLINEPPPFSNATFKGANVGYQIAANAEVTAVWQDPMDSSHLLLKIAMNSPKLSVPQRKNADIFVDQNSSLNDLQNNAAVYVDWRGGQINHFYSPDSESISLVNLKKGIASLFQLQTSSVEVEEVDASGSCNAVYSTVDGRNFSKKKQNCRFQRPASTDFCRNEKILGIATASSLQIEYNMKPDTSIVETLRSTEVHGMRVNIQTQAGASVISRQSLQLENELKGGETLTTSTAEETIKLVSDKSGVNYVQGNLQVSEEKLPCDSCKSFAEAVAASIKRLQADKLATSTAAGAFASLVPIARRSTKEELLSVLKNNKNKNILPQLMDILAAAQTPESHAAAAEVLKFESQNANAVQLAERYLMVLSLSTHPSLYLVEDLLKLSKSVRNAKLGQTALMTLAAVTKAFSSSRENAGLPVVTEVHKYFADNLKKCSDEECSRLYMRVLRNLGSPDSLEIFLSHIDKKDKKTSVAAVKALRGLPASVFSMEKVQRKLQNVYFGVGRSYDSSARSLALDIILEHNPSTEFILDLLSTLSSREIVDMELATYALERLQEFASNDAIIRAKLNQILMDKGQTLKNYDSFALNGMSTTFSRDMYHDVSTNGSFSSSTEAAHNMMKRSSFDVYVRNDQESFHLLSFGLFVSGMGSLMGSTEKGAEEEEEATGGMDITLAGVQLRPFVFFTSQGEVFEHVFMGTASERMSALQGTVLLQDHRQVVPLQSGFFVVVDVLSSVSFDFGGEVQISVWSRSAHSIVDNRAALHLDGSVSLATPFIKSGLDFHLGSQVEIDFESDVSFSGDLLACLKMGQHKFNIDYSVEKRENIPGHKHNVLKKKKRRDAVQGRTYALNSKNSAQCNDMLKKQLIT